MCLLWQSIDASSKWVPEGFRPSWGFPNPLPHPADGLEWSTTVDRWTCKEAYWDRGKGSVSPLPKLPAEDLFAPTYEGQLPFSYLRSGDFSYRRRTGKNFEAISDEPGHTSSGCDNGEQLSFPSATVAQRVIDKNGEQSSSTNGEQFDQNGEQSSSTNGEQSLSTERNLSVVMTAPAARKSCKSSKMEFATQQFPALRL
jgi:hypothetical protein